MRLRNVFALLLLLCGEAAMAAISTGYFRVKSYNDKYLTENATSHVLVCSDLPASANYAQVWYLTVSGSNVTLKNALTDRYVQKTTGSSWSEQYITGVSSNTFTLTELSGDDAGKITFTDKWNGGPHCDASLNVVLWLTDEAKSKWTIEAVDIDDAALAAMRAALTEASASQLQAVFTDLSCSTLKAGYTDKDVSVLPAATQELVSKIKYNSWATYDGWDKTERTFRIADYKAYSSHERWADILGYSNSFGRLSNPTGIYVAAGDYLQVYVGAIPSGQSVVLEVAGYGQASGQQYSLHEGMNSLLMTSSGNCFVFYEVDNTTSGAAPFTALSNYADVTVHIEGGSVQGYLDLTKGDDNEDWSQMQTHLMSQETVCLKSSTHVFNLHKELLLSALGAEGKVKEMMDCWTAVATLEDNLCARGDFYAYCNNIYSVTGHAGSGNPNATTYGTNYYEAEYAGVFNADQLLQYFGGLWTIAHEQGHNRQKLIKLAGTTEVSNNVFSNAVIDWQGRFTSRVLSLQTTFDVWQQGLSWLERLNNKGNDYHLWETLHLYVQLYQYFHQAGKDTDFFPNLFRAFRKSPMTLQAGTPIPATDDYLKFYQTCCDVSGLDLTEFFEVYGFFTLPQSQEPQTINGISTGEYYQVIDDYNTYYVYVNQAMIDEAKANVEAKKYPKCNIIFIEDRVTAPLATYEGHAEGELRQLSRQDNVTAFGQVGETGQYTTFSSPCSAYSYNISPRGNVTIEGTGAVGFKLYDESGKLVGLYNTTTFTLPSSAFDENGLKSGYSLQAAAGDGTSAAAAYDSDVEVNEFPKTGVWYTFCTPDREDRYTTSKGAGNIAVGTQVTSLPGRDMQWKFVPRSGEVECFDIQNRADGSYLSPVPGEENYLSTTSEAPGQGWMVETASDKYIVYSGTTQLHQTNSGHDYKMLNYGYWNGSYNTSDPGALFAIEPAEESLALNVVGDASYATFYGDEDVQTDENTKAYYITSATNTVATLTEVGNEGHDIPARTAVVLINSEKATSTCLTSASGFSILVSEEDNLLKGTLTSTSLDLSDASNYYSLGRKDGQIGFYKFNNNGTTTITLGANKAYLEVPASGSSVKGFTLGFGGEDGLSIIVNSKSANGTWYDLNGRRLSGEPAAKGVYIVGGKKVVVK